LGLVAGFESGGVIIVVGWFDCGFDIDGRVGEEAGIVYS